MVDSLKAFGALAVPMDRLASIQGDYLKSATEMWNQALHRLQGDSQAAQPLGQLAA